MSIAVFIIVINLIIASKVWLDWRAKNKEHRIINHTVSSVISGSLYILASIIILGVWGKFHWSVLIGSVILAVSWRWIIFDLVFAKLNWGVWDKHGTSSRVDVFLTKLGKYHYLIKLVPIAIGIGVIKYKKVLILIENLWEILF